MKDLKKTNNSGFSLVEVICAVAIISLISGIIGTIIVVSARTYRNSVSETSVQQESQLAANSIGNLIKDAIGIEYKNDKLDIHTNDSTHYRITFDKEANKLYYELVDDDNKVSISKQVLASNIEGFLVSADDFDATKTINVDMTVRDSATGKNIQTTYTMNARNEAVGEIEITESPNPVTIYFEDIVCLVPGQGDKDKGLAAYTIPITVSGTLTEGLEATTTPVGGDSNTVQLRTGEVTTNHVEVWLPVGEASQNYASQYTLTISTKDKKEGTSEPVATASATIYIRSVSSMKVKYVVDVSSAEGSTREGAGALYTFSANVTGNNLAQFSGREWDVGYKTAEAVYWKYELTSNGETYTFDSSKPEGSQYSNQSGAEQYVKVESIVEDDTSPKLKISITHQMYSDFSLKVTAVSKHAAGVNKASSYYADITADATVTPRTTKIKDTYEITLEPGQTKDLLLNSMYGGIALDKNVRFVYEDRSVEDNTRTYAIYDYLNKTIKVHIDNSEVGRGDVIRTDSDINPPYSFRIYMQAKEIDEDGNESWVDKTQINVHVRRIDYISFKTESSKAEDSGVTYNFKIRFNTKDSIQDDLLIQYLINTDNMETQSIEEISKTLAVNLTWAIKDTDSETGDDTTADDCIIKGSFECPAQVEYVVIKSGKEAEWQKAVDENIRNKDDTSYLELKSDNKTINTHSLISVDATAYTETTKDGVKKENYYSNFKIKPAKVRLYVNTAGEILLSSMVQSPEIDVKFVQDAKSSSTKKNTTETGLKDGTMFIIKATALHPYAGRHTSDTYTDYVAADDLDKINRTLILKNSTTAGSSSVKLLSGFMRGDDNFLGGDWDFSKLREKYGGSEKTVFRFCKLDSRGFPDGNYGAYYYKAIEGGSNIKINAAESLLFLPQYGYRLELIPILVDDDKLMYPINTDFAVSLGLKPGWKEGTEEMSMSECTSLYDIPAVSMSVVETTESSPYRYVGSQAYINISLSNIKIGNIGDSYYKMYIERKVDDKWYYLDEDAKEYESARTVKKCKNIEIKRNGEICVYFDGNNIISKGLYRIRLVIDNEAFKKISGSTFEWTTTSSTEDTVFDDYIYVQVEYEKVE